MKARPLVLLDCLSLHSGGARAHLAGILGHREGLRLAALVTAEQAKTYEFGPDVLAIKASALANSAIFRKSWRYLNLKKIIRNIGADVYLDPAGGAPALPIPRVTMVRNMLPFDHRVKDWYGTLTYQGFRLAALRRQAIRAVGASEGAIFVSEWSRLRVNEFHTDDSSRASALIPHGVDLSDFEPRPWPSSPRWLYVSDIEPYKHQIEAVLAYDAARSQGCAMAGLTLAGGLTNRDYEKRLRAMISRLRFGSEIELTGWISREVLKQEMDRSDGLLFVSAVECCPNILLEGLASGKPIVCSKEPPMPEFAKDAVVYVDPADPMSIAAGMRSVTRMRDGDRQAMIIRARAEALRYTWKATAERTWAFVEEVASGHRRMNGTS